MSTEESIDIIKNLTLLDKSDSNVSALTKRLDENIRLLKVMHPLKSKYNRGNKGYREKFTALSKSVIKFKKALNSLDDLQEMMLQGEIDRNFYVDGMDNFPDISKICELLTPIERCSNALADHFTQLSEKNSSQKKVSVLNMIYDEFGEIFRDATGDIKRNTRTADNKRYGEFHEYLTDALNLAGTGGSADSKGGEIYKRLKNNNVEEKL